MLRALALVSLSAALCGLVVACSEREEEVAPSEPQPMAAPEADDPGPADDEALGRARLLAKAVGGGLKARLVAAMGEGGPAAAIAVCADEAQSITAQAVGEGQAAGRASTKLRNPENSGPAWVRDWLATQGERASDATPYASVEDGKARVIMPIAIEGVCLSCHGPADAISAEVGAVLAERYPADRATGYAEGDLRGALWAEVSAR